MAVHSGSYKIKLMNWKRIFAWIILGIIGACSASVIIVNRPKDTVDIELKHNNDVDSIGINTNLLDKSKTKKMQKPTIVDSVGSK